MQVGLLDLKITATSSVGKDLLIKQLRVEPEGETIFVNKPVFLDLRNSGDGEGGSVERNITVNIPNAAVEGSERVYLTGTADVVGPAMNNLMNLIRYTKIVHMPMHSTANIFL